MDNFNLTSYLLNNPLLKEKNIFEKFLDGETEYKNLHEFISSIKEADEETIDAANKEISGLNPEEEKLVTDFAVDLAGNPDQNISRDKFGPIFRNWMDNKGEEYGDLVKKYKNKARMAKLLVGALAATVLINTVGAIAGKVIPVKSNPDDPGVKTAQQLDRDFQDDLKNTAGVDDFNSAKAAIDQNSQYNVDPNGEELHVQFDTGESDINDEDQVELEKTVASIAKLVKAGKGTKANIKVAAGVSNQDGPNSNKANDGGDLTQQRLDKTVKAVEDELSKQGVKDKVTVTPIKVDYENSKVTSASDDNDGQAATIGVDFESPEKAKETEKVIKTFNDYLINPPAPEDIPTEPEGKPTEPKTEPSTQKVTANQTEKDVQAAVGGKINRNGQIATVLRTLNFDNLNLFKELGIDGVKSFSDGDLTKIQNDPDSTDKAKEIARGILTIRKNPKTLLDKVSKALNIKFSDRAKAVQTAPGAAGGLSAFTPKLAEIANETLNEAFIDDFISDEDIRKNKVAILALLGSMYATDADSGNYLSILDMDKANLTDTEKDQLTKLGFSPQAGGKDYVFLKSKSTQQTPTSSQPADPDSDKVAKRVTALKPLQQTLKRINTSDELSDLIVGIYNKVNPAATTNARTTLSKASNALSQGNTTTTTGQNFTYSFKPIKEEEKDATDVSTAIDNDQTLSSLLKNNINRPLEFVYTLVKAFLPHINPTLNYNAVKMAFRKSIEKIEKQKKTNEEVDRMKKLAGIKK